MEPIEYLRGLRRRWMVIVLSVGVAIVVGFGTTAVVPVGPPVRTYVATAVLLNTGPLDVPGVASLQTVAALATIKPVLERVAKELDYEGDPLSLSSTVQVGVDQEAGFLKISAFNPDPARATEIADTFVQELLGFLTDRKAETISRQAQSLARARDKLAEEIARIEDEMSISPPDTVEVLRAERDAKIFSYSALSQQYQQLISTAVNPTSLEILQDAAARPVITGGFQPPRSRTSRLLLAVGLGLLFGVVIALVLERLDTKIRTKDRSEQHYGLPVLAEIPLIGRADRGTVVTSTQPTSPAADAFRLLAASISRPNDNGEIRKRAEAGGAGASVILVTSATRREGKSTVVANLGAAFSQVGKRVLILSCDFRFPSLHDLLSVRGGLGLADVLRKRWNGQSILNGHVRETVLPGVQLVTSGSVPTRPSSLLASPGMRRVLLEARSLGDVVLVDTPPILSASDAVHLMGEVDAVLVVARAGQTTADQAQRAGELLKQLDAPVVGLALNASTELPPTDRWMHLRRGLKMLGIRDSDEKPSQGSGLSKALPPTE